MLIRSAVIITVFTVATFLSSCQKDDQETPQPTPNSQQSSQSTTGTQQVNILKTKIVQAMTATTSVKQAVTEYYADNGQFSGAANSMANLPPNVSLDNDTGTITVHLEKIDRSLTNNDTIQLIPEANNGAIRWRCESNISDQLKPPICR